MRPAENFGQAATNALQAVIEESQAELLAQLDDMSTDDLRALTHYAAILGVRVRSEWLNRTTKPASET